MSDIRLQRAENTIRKGFNHLGDCIDQLASLFGNTPKQRPKKKRITRQKKHCHRCGCPHCRGYCPLAMSKCTKK